jgi:tetratricopeptide (TPR) repeat protein
LALRYFWGYEEEELSMFKQSVRGSLAALSILCTLAACTKEGPTEGASSPSNEPEVTEPEPEPAEAPTSTPEVQKAADAIQAKQFQEAKELLVKAVAANTKDALATFYLGVAEEGLENPDGAVTQYHRALELDPKLTDAAVYLSALLLDKGDAEGALAAADKGLAHKADQPQLLTNRALCLEALGRKDEAVTAFGTAADASMDDHQLRYAYAELLIYKGDLDKAKAELAKIKDVPDMTEQVANLYGKAKDYATCISMLDGAIKKREQPDLLLRRGLCKHGAGDEAAARADYEAAIKLDPKSAAAYYYLGESLKAAKDKPGAIKAFDKAAELAPTTGLGKKAAEAAKELKTGKP